MIQFMMSLAIAEVRTYPQPNVYKMSPSQLNEFLFIFASFDTDFRKSIPSHFLGKLLQRSNINMTDIQLAQIVALLDNPYFVKLSEYLGK